MFHFSACGSRGLASKFCRGTRAILLPSLLLIPSLTQGQSLNRKNAGSQTIQTSLPTSGPILITSGGTYSGNWTSNDPNTPAVRIETDQLVVLQNSVITSKGDLIYVSGITTGANVIIENVTGTALDPGISGLQRGKFVYAYDVASLTVQNCSMYGVSWGVDVTGALTTTTTSSLKILNNLGSDLEDRASDGNGGLLNVRPGSGHFVILDKVNAPNGAEIAWNQLVQTIGQTSTEDAINIFESQGSQDFPIWVHDNYLEGMSWPTNQYGAYPGAALITDGGTVAPVTAFVLFETNEVVATAGSGVAVNYGHDIAAKGNRVVSCGVTKNNHWYAWGAFAIEMVNYYRAPAFYNNTITGTLGGMLGPAHKHPAAIDDIWTNPSDMLDSSNTVIGNGFTDPCSSGTKINLGAEDAERSYWAAKIVAAGQLIGDQHLPIS